MEIPKVITDYQNAIIEIIKEYSLDSLSGIDDNYTLNGQNIVTWYAATVENAIQKYHNKSFFDKTFNDLLFCSDEIQFFLANMYLYRPFINNPLKNNVIWNGKVLYLNYPDIVTIRYSMFGTSLSEKIYNYWDRIGDLIYIYFPRLIKQENVYFSKSIDIIPPDFHNSINYRWLKKFRDTDYIELNSKRRNFVHYTTEYAEFQHIHGENPNDSKIIEELFNLRFGLADFYKFHLSQTLIGFGKCLLLLDELSEKTINI